MSHLNILFLQDTDPDHELARMAPFTHFFLGAALDVEHTE